MNILYLNCHDAGRYLQPYGYAVPAPNLQALAERGTLFRNHHSPSPTCSPSRSTLLTGLYPHENGMIGLAHRGFKLKSPVLHLAKHLQSRGYRTAVSGVQHETRNAKEHYDEVLSIPDLDPDPDRGIHAANVDRLRAEAAADFIRRDHDKPFFLACGFILPHRKFQRESAYNPNTVRPPEPLMDRADLRADWARYMTAANSMDASAGILLDALRESGLDKDTLVVFTSDHGPAFPEMKCRLTDFGSNVALIVDFPGNPARGKAVDAMVSNLDVIPTLAEIAGFDPQPGLRGRSLVPLMNGEKEELHDEIFGHVNYHAAYEPMRSVRTETHKLIRMIDSDSRPVPGNCDNSPSKDFYFKEADTGAEPYANVMLFDLRKDPMERHNRAEDPAYAEIRKDLETRLQRHMEETDDPALTGAVPAPEGVEVTPRMQ
jgi:arylsulfatase A-like enzyme